MEHVKFVPFKSFFEADFWHKFAELKLNVDRLSDSSRTIVASFSPLNGSCLLVFNCASFNQNHEFNEFDVISHGKLFNKNTIEEFKKCNKSELIESEGSNFWNLIKNNNCLEDPSLLNTFYILSFADIKKFQFYYWCAFPVSANIYVKLLKKPFSICEEFNSSQLLDLWNKYRSISDRKQKSFFIVQKSSSSNIEIQFFKNCVKDWPSGYDENSVYFTFLDSSSEPNLPGWPMRNYLLFILHHCDFLHGKSIKLIGFRIQRIGASINCENSQILTVELTNFHEINLVSTLFQNDQCNWTGWEKNQDKLMPKFVNMSSTMDPLKLAESAVDLNLKLMKWRLMPNIDLEAIKRLKCLILGAGTLGCAIGRLLLAWGIREISFVDNGKISFSNPVRQNLYFYEDCLNDGKMKATTAADNLSKIFPGAKGKGYTLSIPMPGHMVSKSSEKEVEEDVQMLSNLIETNDVIFLVMDSRESRWFPTLAALKFQKIVINAALGFDSYLVMRHGIRSTQTTPSTLINKKYVPADQLGCYFCNDITAPGNSIQDRTLDQQCTVTRPGVSNIAAALAVELMISITQHPDGVLAKASFDVDAVDYVPHSIRGFLTNASQLSLITQKYNKCIACSEFVYNQYEKDGFDFLLKVFNSNRYLEEITGLSKLQSDTEKLEILKSLPTTFLINFKDRGQLLKQLY